MGFIVLAIVAAIAFFAWRGARQRLDEARRELRARGADKNRAVTLEKDPKTGVYRPRRGE